MMRFGQNGVFNLKLNKYLMDQVFNITHVNLFQKNFFSFIFPNDADMTCVFLGPSSNLRSFSYPNALHIFLRLM